MMFYLSYFTLFVFSFAFLAIRKVLAQGGFGGEQRVPGFGGEQVSVGLENPLGKIETINALVGKILDIVIQIGLPLVALAIVYTGFLFVKARGNESELVEAKKTLLWTVIGAAVILGAFVIQTAISGTITELKK